MTMNPYHALAVYVPRELGDTKEVYGPGLGIESQSGSPSTVTILRRSLYGRRGWRAGDAGGVWSRVTSFEVEGGHECVPLLLRVGACTDELRLMGGERISCLAGAADVQNVYLIVTIV